MSTITQDNSTDQRFQGLAERLMDKAYDCLTNNYIDGFGYIMLNELNQIRTGFSEFIWRNTIIPHLRNHPVYQLAIECPFSSHSTNKPRGYDGDALLIDYLYRENTVDPIIAQSTSNGKDICNYWVSSPAACAVRYRKDLLAYHLNKLANKRDISSMFSVACGHFRELTSTDILHKDNKLKVFGLDFDEETIEYVKNSKYGNKIELINASVTTILRKKIDLEKLDIVYASGLYDYLEDKVAKRLTKILFDMLDHGGYIIIPNFLDSAANRASMELLQDWFLIYRNKGQIETLVDEIDSDEIIGTFYHEDPYKSIGYLFVYKK